MIKDIQTAILYKPKGWQKNTGTAARGSDRLKGEEKKPKNGGSGGGGGGRPSGYEGDREGGPSEDAKDVEYDTDATIRGAKRASGSPSGGSHEATDELAELSWLSDQTRVGEEGGYKSDDEEDDDDDDPTLLLTSLLCQLHIKPKLGKLQLTHFQNCRRAADRPLGP